jgi:integrase
MHSCSVPETLATFDAYLARRGRTRRTREKYAHFLRQFEMWVGDREPGSFTAQELELRYLGQWHDRFEARNGKPPSASTVRHHICALKSYYAFLERFDLIQGRNPKRQIDAPRVDRKANDWLGRGEEEALLRAVRTPQERILVHLLRFTGLRIGEATTLLNEDVDLGEGTITIRQSKTLSGRRVIPILPELRSEIQVWQRYQS